MLSSSKLQWHSLQNWKNTKLIWKHKRPWVDRAVLSRKNPARAVTSPDLTVRQSHSEEGSKVLPQKQTCRTMSCNRAQKQAYTSVDTSFFWQRCQKHKCALEKIAANWTATRTPLDPYLSSWTKINLKLDQRLWFKTQKL